MSVMVFVRFGGEISVCDAFSLCLDERETSSCLPRPTCHLWIREKPLAVRTICHVEVREKPLFVKPICYAGWVVS